jgi:predicted molibdopterin-dependent oxidoreductase YjgC
MYKILFIDEEQETFDDFLDYVELSSTKDIIKVQTQFPLENLDEMVELILKINPDAHCHGFQIK